MSCFCVVMGSHFDRLVLSIIKSKPLCLINPFSTRGVIYCHVTVLRKEHPANSDLDQLVIINNINETRAFDIEFLFWGGIRNTYCFFWVPIREQREIQYEIYCFDVMSPSEIPKYDRLIKVKMRRSDQTWSQYLYFFKCGNLKVFWI